MVRAVRHLRTATVGLLLLLVAWGIAWWNDRRKATRLDAGEWSDDDGAPIADAAPLDLPDAVESASPVDPPGPRAD